MPWRTVKGDLVTGELPARAAPMEMLWRQVRREVTHGEPFASLEALLKGVHAFYDRYN